MDSTASITVENLVWTLHCNQLLEPAQLVELRNDLEPRFRDPRELARELLQRGWLTPFQVHALLNDRGGSLLFGPYVLIERLGEGATGQVFKARHIRMLRVVALKVLRPELLTDPEVVQRFYREVQVISQLSHPHIVHAFDAGQNEQMHYLVMEYVEGDDLGDVVKKTGPLPVAQACDYIYQAALGLQHAFEKGLVHRDIKPSNLIVTRGAAKAGVVKILDLGLARLPRKSSSDSHTPLTMTGTGMMGTPDYLAPEQALDFHQVDIRADLYSLGCTFFYLLTGEPPFPGGTLAQKLMRHQQTPPPPLERYRFDVAANVEAILLKLLAKRMEDRYPTPAALAEDLSLIVGRTASGVALAASGQDDRTLVQGSESPIPLKPKRRTRWLVLAALVVLLIGVASFVVAWPALAPVAPVERERTSGQPVVEASPATLPALQGRQRSFLKGGSENPELLRLDLLAFQRNHPGSQEALQATQLLKELPSPLDRLNEAAIRNDQRRTWMPRETVALLGDNRGRSWTEMSSLAVSGDGKTIAGGCLDGHVVLFDTNTLLDRGYVRVQIAAISAVCLSADGKTLVAAMNNGAGMIAAVGDNRVLGLRHPTNNLLSAALAPGDKLIAIGGADNLVHLWEPAPGGGWRNRIALKGHANGVHRVGFSPDGKWLASGDGNGAVRLWEITGGTIKERQPVLLGHSAAITALAFSPDSRLLVSTAWDKSLRIWSVTEADREPTVLKAEDQSFIAVAVRPDGKQLATALAYHADIQLWEFGDAEPRARAKLTGHATGTLALAYLPNGKTLVSTGRDHRVRLWDVAAKAPHERKVVPDADIGLGGGAHIALSPDNKLLAVHGRLDSTIQLLNLGEAVATERSRLRCYSSPTLHLSFAPDSKSLCTSNYNQLVWCPLGKEPAPVKALHAERLVDAVMSPDGQLMASAGSSDQNVRLWDVTPAGLIEKHVIKLAEPKLEVLALSFHSDGKMLVITGSDNKLHLWDVSGPTPQERGPPLTGLGESVAVGGFSPDGRVLVTIDRKDNRASLWTWTGGKPQLLRALGGDLANGVLGVGSLVFAPDGKTVAVGGLGVEAVAVWNVATGQKLHGWRFPGPVNSVEFSADGRHLITANGNGTTCILRLDRPARDEKR
jgi:serine/threonine protein kinase/WD40 repeat protein